MDVLAGEKSLLGLICIEGGGKGMGVETGVEGGGRETGVEGGGNRIGV